MRDERTYTEQCAALITRHLIGVPKTESAAEINLRLRVQCVTAPNAPLPCSYSLFRRVVRQVLTERARIASWESADDATVRAIRPRTRRAHTLRSQQKAN